MRCSTIDHLLAIAQSVSGVGFYTLASAVAGVVTSVASRAELANLPVDSVVARQLALYSQTLLTIFGMRMAAYFADTMAKLGHQAQVFPRWCVYGSCGVATVLFPVATLYVWLVMFSLWVLVLNGIIWFHGRIIAQE